jgi:hypothetical protein
MTSPKRKAKIMSRVDEIEKRMKLAESNMARFGRYNGQDASWDEVRYLLSQLKDGGAEDDLPRGYWPTLVDHGDGVRGHYCIGRLISPDKSYWEFWNHGKWLSAGQVFIGRDVALATLNKIRATAPTESAATERAKCANCAEAIIKYGDKWEHEYGYYRPECFDAIPAATELAGEQCDLGICPRPEDCRYYCIERHARVCVRPRNAEGQKEPAKCEHGVLWSMECLSCGPSDFIAAPATPVARSGAHEFIAESKSLPCDICGLIYSAPAHRTVAQPEVDPWNDDRCMFCGGKTEHRPDCSHGREPSTTSPSTTAQEAARELYDLGWLNIHPPVPDEQIPAALKEVIAIISKHCCGGREAERDVEEEISRSIIQAHRDWRIWLWNEFEIDTRPSNDAARSELLERWKERNSTEAYLRAEVSRLNSEVERLKSERQEWLTWADNLTGNKNYLASAMRREISQKISTARADAIGETIEKAKEHSTRYRQTGYEDSASVADAITESLQRLALKESNAKKEED